MIKIVVRCSTGSKRGCQDRDKIYGNNFKEGNKGKRVERRRGSLGGQGQEKQRDVDDVRPARGRGVGEGEGDGSGKWEKLWRWVHGRDG